MPIYEYRCDEGHEVEVMQSITEEPLEKCPECGSPTRRVLHSPAIHFKGSGFHNTDYGTKSRNKARESGESGDSGGGSSPGSNGSDSGSGSKSADSTSAGSKDSGSSGDSGSKSDSKD